MAEVSAIVFFAPRSLGSGAPADVAQLVERNLAKVEVAGSSPVVRSREPMGLPDRLVEQAHRPS